MIRLYKIEMKCYSTSISFVLGWFFFAPFVSLCFQLLKRLVHRLFSFPLRRVGWVIQDSGSECPCFISAIQTFYNAT